MFARAPVDGEVKPHQLGELGLAVAQHVGEVVGPVQVGVDGSDAAAFAVQVAVDLGSDARQLGNQVHGVLIDKLQTRREEVSSSVLLGHSIRTERVGNVRHCTTVLG